MSEDNEYMPLYRRDGLANYLSHQVPRPAAITGTEFRGMSRDDRLLYNETRFLHLSAGILIRTPQVGGVLDDLEDLWYDNRGLNSGHTGLVLTGDGTMGKTTITKAAMQQVFQRTIRRNPDWREDGQVPCVYIEVPPKSSGRPLSARFASFLGMTVIHRDTMETITERVVEQLVDAKTQLIVVDEMQNLSSRDSIGRESLAVLKSLHNRLPATFIYSGVGLEEGDIFSGDVGAQLRGRFQIHRLRSYGYETAAQKATWRGLIRAVEAELHLFSQKPGDLEKHAEMLHEKTGGSIGSLLRVLTRAASRTIRAAHDPDEEHIALDLLERIRVDMAAEARQKAKARKPVSARPASSKKARARG